MGRLTANPVAAPAKRAACSRAGRESTAVLSAMSPELPCREPWPTARVTASQTRPVAAMVVLRRTGGDPVVGEGGADSAPGAAMSGLVIGLLLDERPPKRSHRGCAYRSG